MDGTTNYAHGLPIFCSSLALEIDGELAVGAVFDPTRQELFTAERGAGARLNGEPLRVSTSGVLIDSLLVTGFPYSVQTDPGELTALFGEFLTKSRAVRRLGSAALDLCYVAAGRFDAFWEQTLQPWDVAAGALIVSESGGQVTTIDGRRSARRQRGRDERPDPRGDALDNPAFNPRSGSVGAGRTGASTSSPIVSLDAPCAEFRDWQRFRQGRKSLPVEPDPPPDPGVPFNGRF